MFMSRKTITPSHFVHETAILDDGVKISDGVKVWAYCHLSRNVEIGEDVIIGERVYVGPEVCIGKNSKIQNNSLIYEPSQIKEGVFVGPNVIFTNDKIPRATNPDGSKKSSDDWKAQGVSVQEGASIGAGSICIAPVTIGKFAMVGAGSVVNRDVKNFECVVGNPIRFLQWVCKCGIRLEKVQEHWFCNKCNSYYENGLNGLEICE